MRTFFVVFLLAVFLFSADVYAADQNPQAPAAAAANPMPGSPEAKAILNTVPEVKTENKVEKPAEIRTLPGGLDSVLMFNSNSPEVVKVEGILCSTLSPEGKQFPLAHLNQTFEGNFQLFAHHINNTVGNLTPKTLYIGCLVHNPGSKKVTVKIGDAASYLSMPDSPFNPLPDFIENPLGDIHAGPGDRVMDEMLRHKRQKGWPKKLVLKPNQSKLVFSLPLPVTPPFHAINGRSVLAKMWSSGPVNLATLALFSRTGSDGKQKEPAFSDWEGLLKNSDVAGPRDKVPSVPGAGGNFVYGRVAGVQRGAIWNGTLIDNATKTAKLRIPQPGSSFTYPLATVDKGTFGTLQVQSAPLVVRYADTAYQAHGNYAVEYDLKLPLFNDSDETRTVSISFQTPVKTNEKFDHLTFFEPPAKQVFFRGTVELLYRDNKGRSQTTFIHLVQKRGDKSKPLVELTLKPKKIRLVRIRFLYPPDATPPQCLTVETQSAAQ